MFTGNFPSAPLARCLLVAASLLAAQLWSLPACAAESSAAAGEVRLQEPETVVMEELTLPTPRRDVPEEALLEELPPLSPAQETPEGPGASITVIAIDAGHGGADFGCINPAILEKDFTLAVARHTARLLENSFGGRVILTRTQDANPSLEVRARLAKAQGAGLLISIHAGASISPSAHGFELFVPPATHLDAGAGAPPGPRASGARRAAAQSTEIAHRLADELARSTGAVNRGVRAAPCRLFEAVDFPCVVVEVGSLTNYAEASKLAEDEYQMKIAQGLADGIRACAAGAVRNGEAP
ncbi:MAG TPA: N-acetylmuramoyl-L-alanine amidase [Candidatus Hydrogenedentes bacterium]|nr:N-acetylmuramoyl-L-alanine amidase [Candidatus Hydrogenedentota bacterium]